MPTEEEIYRIFQDGQAAVKQTIAEGGSLRVAIPRAQWEYMHSENLEEAVTRAVELGWADNKVQVKRYQVTPETVSYYIEPFEEDCSCPNLLKYEDYVNVALSE